MESRNNGFSRVAVLVLVMVLGAVAVGGYTWYKEKGIKSIGSLLYQTPDGKQEMQASDEPEAIEKDLKAEDLSDIDTDVNQAQTELNASY